MKKIKVYCLNEYEWWVGSSWKEVQEDYLQMTGVPKEEAFCDEYIVRDKEMKELTYVEEDGTYKTFKEKLDELIKEGKEFPCCFAVSEY